MSDYGEGILDRLPLHSSLQDEDNPARKVIDNTVGEWLDKYEDNDLFNQFFLSDAKGQWLDLHGRTYGLRRKIGESDEVYRNRIIYETMGHLTVGYLKSVYNVELYTNVNDFSLGNSLVSDNPYMASKGFIGVADEDAKKTLNRKFVLDTDITWVEI